MSRKNTIFRVHKSENYTVIHNSVLKNKNLSWKAKGILTYLLSLPNDWKINMNDLKKRATDGINSLTTGVKELENAGYIKRYPIKDDKGKIKEWAFNVYEMPVNENPDMENPDMENPDMENPDMENPDMENPDMENQSLLNTNNIQNTNNILNTNNTNDIVEQKPDDCLPYDDIVDYYHKTCTDLPKIRSLTEKRKSHIKARIKEYGVEAIYEVFDKTAASDFLSGRKTDWRASFDWLLLPTNFVKVLEDQYKNDKKYKQQKARYEVENPDWLQEHVHYRKSKVDDAEDVDPEQLKNLLDSFKEDEV